MVTSTCTPGAAVQPAAGTVTTNGNLQTAVAADGTMKFTRADTGALLFSAKPSFSYNGNVRFLLLYCFLNKMFMYYSQGGSTRGEHGWMMLLNVCRLLSFFLKVLTCAKSINDVTRHTRILLKGKTGSRTWAVGSGLQQDVHVQRCRVCRLNR